MIQYCIHLNIKGNVYKSGETSTFYSSDMGGKEFTGKEELGVADMQHMISQT